MKFLWKILSNSKFHYLIIFLTFFFSLKSFFLYNKDLILNNVIIKASNNTLFKQTNEQTISHPAFNKKNSNFFLSVIIPLNDIELNKNNNIMELPFLKNLVLNLKKYTNSKFEIIFIVDEEKEKNFEEEYLKNFNNDNNNIKIYYVLKKKFLGSGNMILNGLYFARGENIMILNENILNYSFLEHILKNPNKNNIYYGYKNNYNNIERVFNYFTKFFKINVIDIYSNIIIMTKFDLKKIFNELNSFSFQIKYEILKLADKNNININQFKYNIENNIIDFKKYFNIYKIREFLLFLIDILKIKI